MVNNWINIIQDCLFPPTCLLCTSSGYQSRDLCYACYNSLPVNNYCCYRCGEILENATAIPFLCGQCQNQRPAFDETHAPFLYQGTIRHLIYSLKFNARYKNARLLGTLLAEHLAESAELPDCILPVPLHPSRYRERGFNQSIEIARTVSKELKIPLDLSSCRRNRNTAHQTNLSAKQRRNNMKNAFTIVKPISAGHVAILDDVMTTGTTVHELAKTLVKSGVSRVGVWVCARA